MFMRFVITRTDPDSHKPQGVFAAAYSLLDSGELSPPRMEAGARDSGLV